MVWTVMMIMGFGFCFGFSVPYGQSTVFSTDNIIDSPQCIRGSCTTICCTSCLALVSVCSKGASWPGVTFVYLRTRRAVSLCIAVPCCTLQVGL